MAKKIDYASMFTLRKDGRYQASYVDNKGRHYLYDKDPERLWHKLNDPKEAPPILFKDIAESWDREHAESVEYNTSQSYVAPLRRINNVFGDEKIEDIRASDISAFLLTISKQGFSKRTVQLHRDIINMIFNHAIILGHTRDNPCVAVSLPKNLPSTRRGLPPDEAIKAIKDNYDKPFGLFAAVCLYAGLRRGEALALQYEDIDRKKKVIHITKSVAFVDNNPHIKTPKTAAGTRDVILLDALDAILPDGTGYIFNKDGKLLTKSSFRKRWLRYCKEIGYDFTAHQLRHAYATTLLEAGIDAKDAQDLLGHANISTTRDIYTHIRQSRRTETANKLNAFLAKQ